MSTERESEKTSPIFDIVGDLSPKVRQRITDAIETERVIANAQLARIEKTLVSRMLNVEVVRTNHRPSATIVGYVAAASLILAVVGFAAVEVFKTSNDGITLNTANIDRPINAAFVVMDGDTLPESYASLNEAVEAVESGASVRIIATAEAPESAGAVRITKALRLEANRSIRIGDDGNT